MNNVMLSAALSLAARGYPVFPCQPRGKAPLYASPHPAGSPERATCRGECGRWGHGLLDATTDEATITAWWGRTPSANLAIATGAPGPDVVDIDTKKGAPGVASFNRLRDAGLLRGSFAVITTPSGGWHLYYQGTTQPNATRPAHGVDFRGLGGYVLTVPSYVVAPDHAYEGAYLLAEHGTSGGTVDWAAVRDHLDPPRPRRTRRSTGKGTKSYEGLVKFLESRPAGGRNGPLYWAVCRAVEDGADEHVYDELHDAICRAGHSPRDAARTIESARRRAVTS